MSTQLTYFPPDAVSGITSVVFGTSAPYIIRNMEGLGGLPNEPATTRAPFQPGVSLLDNRMGARRMTVQLLVVTSSRDDFWVKRDELAHAFSVVPRFDQRVVEKGILRLQRDGQDDIEIEVIPEEGGPRFTDTDSPTIFRAEIDLFAPSPWWENTSDLLEFFESSGGIEIIEEGNTDEGLAITEEGLTDEGVAIPLDQETATINNDGHVPTPFTLTIEGQVEDPRLVLDETGEELGLIGTIPSGQSVRISTEFGGKEITLIDQNGNESNAFNLLDTDRADFFWLQRGNNTLSGTFTTNVNGSMSLTWRKRYSGA